MRNVLILTLFLLGVRAATQQQTNELRHIDEICRAQVVKACLQTDVDCAKVHYSVNSAHCDLGRRYHKTPLAQGFYCDAPWNPVLASSCSRAVKLTTSDDLTRAIAAAKDALKRDLAEKFQRQDCVYVQFLVELGVQAEAIALHANSPGFEWLGKCAAAPPQHTTAPVSGLPSRPIAHATAPNR